MVDPSEVSPSVVTPINDPAVAEFSVTLSAVLVAPAASSLTLPVVVRSLEVPLKLRQGFPNIRQQREIADNKVCVSTAADMALAEAIGTAATAERWRN